MTDHQSKNEKTALHMAKMAELMAMGKVKDENWLKEYVEFHVKTYGIKESKRIAGLPTTYKLCPEFSRLVDGYGHDRI